MEKYAWIPMFGGLCFGLATVVFLVTAVVARSRLLLEEKGALAIMTVFPLSINASGRRYAGPFSRLSLYPGFLVIRALGASRFVRRIDFECSPVMREEWIILSVKQNGLSTQIKVSTNNNPDVLEKISKWLNEASGLCSEPSSF